MGGGTRASISFALGCEAVAIDRDEQVGQGRAMPERPVKCEKSRRERFRSGPDWKTCVVLAAVTATFPARDQEAMASLLSKTARMLTPVEELRKTVDAIYSTTGAREDKLDNVGRALLDCARRLASDNNMLEMKALFMWALPQLDEFGLARGGRMLRELVQTMVSIEQDPDIKTTLCEDAIEWAARRHCTFLRRDLQLILAQQLNLLERYASALKLTQAMSAELRRNDDRRLACQVAVEESYAAGGLNNWARARLAIVVARTAATSTNVESSLQAAVDLQSGIVFMCDSHDYRTAFSYLYEAFEGFRETDQARLIARAFKLMCLCKIMLNRASDVRLLLAMKGASAVRSSKGAKAMCALALAFEARSQKAYSDCLREHKLELDSDPVVRSHFTQLHAQMLEQAVIRVLSSYSRVDLRYLAQEMDVEVVVAERIVRTMILDRKIAGHIDQQNSVVTTHRPAKHVFLGSSRMHSFFQELNKTHDLLQRVAASDQR